MKSLDRVPRGPVPVIVRALRLTSTPSGTGRTRCDFRIVILAKGSCSLKIGKERGRG